MSAKIDAAGDAVECPPGEVTVTEDGERVRVKWFPVRDVTRTALFRIATDDGVAILQHIREVRVSHAEPTAASLDEYPKLADIPRCLRATLRDLGLEPATEVGR